MSDLREIRVYTLEEVKDILKVTRRSVYNYIKDGRLTARKIGREWRVRHEDLQNFIGGHSEKR